MSPDLQNLHNQLATSDRLNDSLKFFFERVNSKGSILEIGTRRWGEASTHHQSLFPEAAEYVMTDGYEGEDVHVVADPHALSAVFPKESFDAVWSSFVWERLRSPWVAAEEVLRVLKPGGVFFIQTRHTFPQNSYPSDFWRFTKEALAHIFSTATQVVACNEFPCQITPTPPILVWNPGAPAWLNSNIAGIK